VRVAHSTHPCGEIVSSRGRRGGLVGGEGGILHRAQRVQIVGGGGCWRQEGVGQSRGAQGAAHADTGCGLDGGALGTDLRGSRSGGGGGGGLFPLHDLLNKGVRPGSTNMSFNKRYRLDESKSAEHVRALNESQHKK